MSFIDDTHPTIQYSIGDWVNGGVLGEFRSTAHASMQGNARATITFEGTAISVYGTIEAKGIGSNVQGPVSTYTIDGGTPTTFRGVPGASAAYQQAFFASGPLPEGNHTLVVENSVTGPVLVIDYLEYTPVSTSSVAPTASTGLSDAPSSSVNCKISSGTQVPLGATIGAVIGSVVFTLLACIAGIYIFRRRKETCEWITVLIRCCMQVDQKKADSAPSEEFVRPFGANVPSSAVSTSGFPSSAGSTSGIQQNYRSMASNMNPPPY
ncbi:hypothetical protein C8J56DRAFT_10080 [Mycena floridula]|nr:hypothetical protein C8J56DRAFT_10080 [Mycena floridula]